MTTVPAITELPYTQGINKCLQILLEINHSTTYFKESGVDMHGILSEYKVSIPTQEICGQGEIATQEIYVLSEMRQPFLFC